MPITIMSMENYSLNIFERVVVSLGQCECDDHRLFSVGPTYFSIPCIIG